jgi:hypothetical protein
VIRVETENHRLEDAGDLASQKLDTRPFGQVSERREVVSHNVPSV